MLDGIVPGLAVGREGRPLDRRSRVIGTAILKARERKPAYEDFYPFLGNLFLAQERSRAVLDLDPLSPETDRVRARRDEGTPLLKRWEFPVGLDSAEGIRRELGRCIPMNNPSLRDAFDALSAGLRGLGEAAGEGWRSFLSHDGEPWKRWIDTKGVDEASLLFLGRSCLRPSVEWTASDLQRRFPSPEGWKRGYCPVCGSLPSLLMLRGEGGRTGYCSWCGSEWALDRMRCPLCDNSDYESQGYLHAEEDPLYRVQYCRLCRSYFKLIDLRESADTPYLPLEEWTTLHLDLLARQKGWNAPPSPSPAVYGPTE